MNEDHREVAQVLESANKDVKAAIMCTLTATYEQNSKENQDFGASA